jgi:hypothetical protein
MAIDLLFKFLDLFSAKIAKVLELCFYGLKKIL